MKSGTTTIANQEIDVYGFTITLDIDVAWTSDPGVWRRADGSGEPPSIEIDEIGFDEDQALSDLLHAWAECEPARRPPGFADATKSDMLWVITQNVADYVDTADLPDDGPQNADDREEDDDDGN